MSDYIDRQAAIDAVYRATGDGDKADFCADVIWSVPLADVEPVRHAKRIVCYYGEDSYGYVCEKCETPVDSCDNFCRGCGAKLDGR